MNKFIAQCNDDWNLRIKKSGHHLISRLLMTQWIVCLNNLENELIIA